MRKRKTGKFRHLKIFIAIFIFSGLGFALFNESLNPKDEHVISQTSEHKNPIDLKLRNFSDQNITQNAIISDSRFRNISFDSQKSIQKSFLQNQLATVYRTVTSIKAPSSKSKESGTWVWTPILEMTPEYIESILVDAKRHNINTIYLSIDSYLDIYMMPNNEEKDQKLTLFVDHLESFIQQANSLGIKVDAEAGWRNWAEVGHTYKPIAVINFVKDFNKNQKYDFRSLQYDIEPYLLPEYRRNEVSVLKNFVTLIDDSISLLEDSDLKFSVVIPAFYDKKDGVTSRFIYNGENDYVFKHLLSILDKKEDSTLIIMSYRNTALGEDGSVEISMNEIRTAEEGFYKTKIIIAQETGEVLPPYITFHNSSKKDLMREVALLEAEFKSYSNFGGTAYHYANSLFGLK